MPEVMEYSTSMKPETSHKTACALSGQLAEKSIYTRSLNERCGGDSSSTTSHEGLGRKGMLFRYFLYIVK